jgi:hypothetical protein
MAERKCAVRPLIGTMIPVWWKRGGRTDGPKWDCGARLAACGRAGQIVTYRGRRACEIHELNFEFEFAACGTAIANVRPAGHMSLVCFFISLFCSCMALALGSSNGGWILSVRIAE